MSNRTCWWDECRELRDKWGMCTGHYDSWHDKYRSKRVTRIHGDLAERFGAYVVKGEPGDCWIWAGALDINGYGVFSLGIEYGSKMVKTHRFSYEFHIGPIDDGLELDHLCRMRPCCNPAHLEPVTQKENTLRGIGFAAQNVRKSHCPQGHPYSDANTYVTPNGWRQCIACRSLMSSESAAERVRRYRERHGLNSGLGKGGYQTLRTHCPQSHPYNAENTIWEGNRRRCRTCVTNRRKARNEAKKRAKKS